MSFSGHKIVRIGDSLGGKKKKGPRITCYTRPFRLSGARVNPKELARLTKKPSFSHKCDEEKLERVRTPHFHLRAELLLYLPRNRRSLNFSQDRNSHLLSRSLDAQLWFACGIYRGNARSSDTVINQLLTQPCAQSGGYAISKQGRIAQQLTDKHL